MRWSERESEAADVNAELSGYGPGKVCRREPAISTLECHADDGQASGLLPWRAVRPP
jgi:hypothetical protein